MDNVQFFKENSERGYCESVQKIIESKPFGNHKFYIFQFVKRVNDEMGIKMMYHQPRLTKPEPLPGTTLLHCDPNDPGAVKILWTLPNQENFGLYKHGKMFSDPFVYECVQQYLKNPAEMMKAEPGDLSDEKIREIYRDIKSRLKPKEKRKEANSII
jgi:hypothetical protein